ncbi:hypothetical protein AJ80_06901 [Polytolypa hystricis UAMH7299]|uniref:Uncharacterized protein n=1 Tax=Polytolypa hystricis (strain UAMH7299) TaxID=1447883 RepID=A0A2B7XRT0_POLH7|nr:hypothetical protein AJ80_06901 [Polytolypa hystricis UAMH7299]
MLLPIIASPSENVPLPLADLAPDENSMHASLAVIHLQIHEAYHRLLFGLSPYPFIPSYTYVLDSRFRSLPSLLLSTINNYNQHFQRLDPNCVIMWHHMCMTLSADMQIFELAAERSGPGPGRKALDDIASWSQSPTARPSDDTMFHAVIALFSAALVLGLYTFMLPRMEHEFENPLSIELLDDIDWTQVQDEGLATGLKAAPAPHPPPPASSPSSTEHIPALFFIRHGGTIYIRGVAHQLGLQSARHILPDYAGLLKDTGKWSVHKFSYVLHSMSDVLMDFEE